MREPWLLLGLVTCAALSGCSRPVEPGVFVIVRSNIADIERVTVQLSRDGRPDEGGRLFFNTQFPVRRAAPDIVGSLAVRAPTDRPDTRLYVSATAWVGDREVVTQRALVTFDPRRQQRLTMFLAAECERFTACDRGQTCTRGPQCVDENVGALPSVQSEAGVEPLITLTDAAAAQDSSSADAAMDSPARDAAMDEHTDASRSEREQDAMDAGDSGAFAEAGEAMDAAMDTRADGESVPDVAQDVYLEDRSESAVDAGVRITRAPSVVVGGTHVCVRLSRRALCWGSRSHGQLGDGVIAADTTGPFEFSQDFHMFALGVRHTCALAGSVAHCWGDGADDALGRAVTGSAATPMQTVPPVTNALILTAGGRSSCAGVVGSAHLFECWGDNRVGQLGIAAPAVVPAPTRAYSTGAMNLRLPTYFGTNTNCISLGSAPWLACAGANDRFQLGAAAPTQSAALVPVATATGSYDNGGTGEAHTCVRRAPGDIECFGDNSELQCGRGAYTGAMLDVPPPPQPLALIEDPRRTWQVVDAGRRTTCAIDATGFLFCWGSNEFGQLGTGSMSPRRSAAPLRVAIPEPIVHFNGSADSDVNCAVATSGRVYCWGDNRWGQLGVAPRALGVAEPTPTPNIVPL